MKKFFLLIPIVSIFIAFLFVDAGPNSWTQLLNNAVVFNDCIAINPTNQNIIFAGTNGAGVYMSTDGGATWSQVNTGLTDLAVQVLTISQSSPTTLYAGGITGGMFKTTNSGTSWSQVNTGITEVGKNIQAIAVKTNDPNTVVIAVYDGVNNATTGVYKTTDGGNSWNAAVGGILSLNHNFLSLAATPAAPNTLYLGGTFVASTYGVHIYKSYNFGTTWIDISNGIDTTTTGTDACRDLSISTVDTNTVLAGRFFNTTNGGPWLTTNGGTTWVQKPGGIPVAAGLLIRSCKIRPGSNSEFYLGLNASTTSTFGGVWRTTDGGTTWLSFNSTVMDTTKTVRSVNFRTLDNTLYAGVAAVTIGTTGVYAYTIIPPPPPAPTLLSPVNGATGQPTTVTLSWNPSAGATSYRVQLATDSLFGSPIVNDSTVSTTSRVVSGLNNSTLYYWRVNAKNAGGTSSYSPIWHFTTAAPGALCEGFNSTTFPPSGWTSSGAGSTYWGRQTVSGYGNGTGSAMYDNYSAPTGTVGNLITLTFQATVSPQDSIHFALAYCQWSSFPNDSLVIYSSTNGGTTYSMLVRLSEAQLNTASASCTHPFTPVASDWGRRAYVLPVGTNKIQFSAVSGFGDHLYIDSVGLNPCWNYIGIKDPDAGIPKVYSLSQNYPNPFNPVTKIEYALPKAGNVEMKVYDILGKEVITLVSENKPAGNYSVGFDGTNLASGVYFYRLVSGDFTSVKKMLLVK